MSQGIATDFSAGDTEGGAETPDAQAGKAAAAEDAPADDPQGGDFPSRKGATRQDGAPASQSQRQKVAAAGEAHDEAPGEAPHDMAAFLRELDPTGQMDQYAERLRSEFASRTQLRAAIVDEKASGLAMVDPAVFEALQMRALGHKLLFVRGLKKLSSSE
ncbi:unnamed protein product [Symbiodinium microadriaticum]|nr:unnamed protein product [Symbiodinium microadriaticum]